MAATQSSAAQSGGCTRAGQRAESEKQVCEAERGDKKGFCCFRRKESSPSVAPVSNTTVKAVWGAVGARTPANKAGKCIAQRSTTTPTPTKAQKRVGDTEGPKAPSSTEESSRTTHGRRARNGNTKSTDASAETQRRERHTPRRACAWEVAEGWGGVEHVDTHQKGWKMKATQSSTAS